MKKLVTALFIVLPLVLVIALFAVTSVAGITANVHATGLVISNKGDGGVHTFDMYLNRTPIEEWELGVDVLPMAAKDRTYSLKITDPNTDLPSDIVSRDETGLFHLNDVGVAKLTYYSNDGGYSDSVLFNVVASGIIDFTPSIKDAAGNEIALEEGTDTDYIARITTGDFTASAAVYPQGAAGAIRFASSDESKLKINAVNGGATALYSGSSIITVSAPAAGISKTIEIAASPCADITIDGKDAATEPHLHFPTGASEIYAVVETDGRSDNISVSGNLVASSEKTKIGDNVYRVKVALASAIETESSNVAFTLNVGGESYLFYVDFSDYKFSIISRYNYGDSNEVLLLNGRSDAFLAIAEPSDDSLVYSWSLSNESFARITSQDGGYCEIEGLATGSATLTVHWQKTNENGDVVNGGEIVRQLTVIQAYTSLLFGESGASFGLGKLAIPRYVYGQSNNLNQYLYKADFRAFDGKDAAPSLADIEFISSSPLVQAEASDSGLTIKALGDVDDVSVVARWKYADIFGGASATLSFRAVDGVLVNGYAQLKRAMDNSMPAVLDNDVYLGEQLFDIMPDGSRTPKYSDAEMKAKLLAYTDVIETTYDWTYYQNSGLARPTVRYALEFNASVYGNGHFISGEYLTNVYDNAGQLYDYAVYSGPLDFVATSNGGIKLAAVKAQDNIVFLARKDGININNVELKGCDDESIYSQNDNGETMINLSLLKNAGTTLEIMADVSVSDSRIKNGRTVARVFGRSGIDKSSDVNVAEERIDASFDGCVLQNACEFILKVGTNRFVQGTVDNPSPALLNENGEAYKSNSAICDQYVNDSYFVNNYLLTAVTLKDSSLMTSGLFSVGMESHFAGTMLADGATFSDTALLSAWKDLAATSYPALLRLVGDVKLADWKVLANVDSSTLIESDATNDSLAFLKLDISAMINTVRNLGATDGVNPYSNIIDDRDGEEYVHGGIAFYGGGKNYSMLDASQYTFEPMNTYLINISVLGDSRISDANLRKQGMLLPLAAGVEDFRFVMFDKTSKFDHNAQNGV